MATGQDKKELQRYLDKLKLIGDSDRVNYAESQSDKGQKKTTIFLYQNIFPTMPNTDALIFM